MLSDAKLFMLLKKLSKELPHFPDGRINYGGAKIAPVINCVLFHKGKILLLKRSQKVGNYREMWNPVGGYIDEFKPVKQKALEEIKEELGIRKKDIKRISVSEPIKIFDRKIGKTWIVHPVLAELAVEPKIKLDWENTDYKWILPEELRKFKCVPGAQKIIETLLCR